jgi:integrase
MVLSLYVKIAPRRNEDYNKMFISVDGVGTDDKTKNWLDLKNKNFIFNVFKTSKEYPNQIVSIPDELLHVIEMYLRFYPANNFVNGDAFLVFADGSPLKSVNSITRILNKVFGKSVGCSMLRHSYLTSKYGDVNKEKNQDAVAMGHSIQTQSDYVLN